MSEKSHIEKMRNSPDYAKGYLYALEWAHAISSSPIELEIRYASRFVKENHACVD